MGNASNLSRMSSSHMNKFFLSLLLVLLPMPVVGQPLNEQWKNPEQRYGYREQQREKKCKMNWEFAQFQMTGILPGSVAKWGRVLVVPGTDIAQWIKRPSKNPEKCENSFEFKLDKEETNYRCSFDDYYEEENYMRYPGAPMCTAATYIEGNDLVYYRQVQGEREVFRKVVGKLIPGKQNPKTQ